MHRMFVAALAGVSLVAAPAAAQKTATISAKDKAQGAQYHPQFLAQYGGAMTGPQAAYVERVGKRVAVQSGLSNAQGDFTVTLVDSPVENAFAIPGGYVYVTRQLLALMNSEAELASVLGHEIGHVAARHSNKRNSRSTLASILAAGVGAVTGSDALGQIAGYGSQLYTLGYSRSQEYEADGLGIRYMTTAGYDPYAAASMLTALDSGTKLQARIAGRADQQVPGWASTHPNSADRVARARTLAGKQTRAVRASGEDSAFLRMLDGLPYDDSPQQGVVEGRVFSHPMLKLRFTAPAGFTLANATDAVTISGSNGQARFEGGPATADLPAYVTQRFTALAGNNAGNRQLHGEIRRTRINGLDAAYATGRASSNGKAVDVTIVAYRFPAATYQFTVVTPSGAGLGALAPLVESMTPLSDAQAAQIRTRRIRIVPVRAGDTIDSLSARMAYADYRRERFMTLNALGAGDTLRPGRLVKLVVTD
ncbi:MAG: peptidase M48 Ste24p [Sphingomonas sp. SCN 67-18]|uniref:M48 family metalloprotease n=1 Tax=uncultured Sphingomonas sp. TaxID=158754 RepID=UPI00086EB4C2|nr:M48 family metalloprotease [Sphingomonas sp. SCN 67-18]ODU21876.1 MAG: peptidase M48 Ste24p [Sphingomonas sp. SCN 67-18]